MLHPFLAQCAGALSGVDLTTGLPMAMLSAGFVGSWAHCTTMCGVHTLTSSCANECQTHSRSQSLVIPTFHAGRMTSYALLAALTYVLFHVGFAWSPYRQYISVFMLFLAGVMFLGASVPLFSAIWPWVRGLKFPMPSKLQTQFYKLAYQSNHSFVRGFFLGFMPCGLLFSALLAAAAAPNFLISQLSIGAFVIGTIPALVTMQMVGNSAVHHAPQFWRKAKTILTAINGIFFISLGVYLAVTGF